MKRSAYQPPQVPEGWSIRTGRPEDWEAAAALERACFPPAGAADPERIRDRLKHFPDCFWLLFCGDRLVSMVDGMATDQEDLTDDLYADASLHAPDGDWQMLFGVCTAPDMRGRGCAGLLLGRVLSDSARRDRKGVVLTCKDALVPFYARFGFFNEGRTEKSCHGNAVWNQMRVTFL